jgi:MFS family permease
VRPDNRTIGLERATLILLGTVQVTLIASITLITVALPEIQRDLGADPPDLVLVASAYGLSFSGLLLLGGRLADLLGSRRTLFAGMTVFGAASAVAAAAPGLGVLLAARLGEGAGAALAAPAAMALVGDVLPDRRRHGRAMAVWGVLSSSGATAGNVLSGVAATWMSWRWLFLLPLAVAIVTVAAARRLVPEGVPRSGGRIDWPGAFLATAGLGALLYGLGHSAWAVAIGLALLVLFGLVEHHSPVPLTPLPFVRGRALPLIATALSAAAMATAFYLLALYLQQVRGLSPLRTSMVLLLPAPALAAAGVLAGPLITRLGARRVMVAGMVVAAAGLFLLARLGLPYAGLVVFPLGAGTTFAAATVSVMNDVPPGQAGLAGGVLNSAMEIGPPAGLTLLTSLAAAHSRDVPAGYAFALRAAATAFVLTALTALLRRGTK